MLHHAVDPRIGGAGIEGQYQCPAGIGGDRADIDTAHREAAAYHQYRGAQAAQQGAGTDKGILRIRTAVAGDGQGGAVEVVEGAEFLVEYLDVVVHHHRGLFGRCYRPAQGSGRAEVEAGIQRPGGGVTRQGKIGETRHRGIPGCHNLAVVLDRNAIGFFVACANRRGDLAGTVKAAIQRTGGGITRQGKIQGCTLRVSGCHDLAV